MLAVEPESGFDLADAVFMEPAVRSRAA